MNEKKQSLTITEKEGQGTFMLDKTGISLSFKENSIKITEEGILITAGKHNIDMKAAGISATSKDKLEMTGSKGIKMDGGAQVEIVGKKIDLK